MEKLAFSTLGCPDWDLETILKRAQKYGFAGVELRGIKEEMYLPRLDVLRSESFQAQLEKANVEVVCLGSSAYLAQLDEGKWKSNMQEARDYIDLAEEMRVPYVRVFGGRLREEGKTVGSIDRVKESLHFLGEYAAKHNVIVVWETHDDFTAGSDIGPIIEDVDHPHIGVIWDINHPIRLSGENYHDTFRYLRGYIEHVHIKDSIPGHPRPVPKPVGKGDLPVKEIVDLLLENGYDGYFSLEWEKRWKPEIAEPEKIFPGYVREMQAILAGQE